MKNKIPFSNFPSLSFYREQIITKRNDFKLSRTGFLNKNAYSLTGHKYLLNYYFYNNSVGPVGVGVAAS